MAITNRLQPAPIALSPAAPAPVSRKLETFSLVLLAAGFAVIEALIGGTRLLFSLPAYALLGLLGLTSLLSLRSPRPAPSQICLFAATIFFGYLLVRACLSPVVYLAREDAYPILGALLVYFFVACLFTDANRRFVFVFFLLALALVHTCIGAIQFRNDDNFMPIPFLQRFDYGVRASGFYVCPNHLAGFLEVVGLFGLGAICWGRWPRWAKLVIGYLVAICYLGLALTVSRGGYLSAGTGLLVFAGLSLVLLLRAGTRRFWKIAGATIGAAAIITVAVIIVANKSFYVSARAHTVVEDTDNIRVDLWQAALQQWKLAPLWGTGSGTYLYYGRQFRSERVQADPVEAHNDYLHLLAEYGIAGTAGFLFFLGAHLYRGWKNLRRLGPKGDGPSTRILSNRLALQISALAAVAAYMVHSAFDFNLHIPANALLLAFVFGLLANPGIRRGDSVRPPPISLMLWHIVLPVIGVLLIIQCVRLLPGEYFSERARAALRDNDPDSAARYALRGLEIERSNQNLYDYLGRAQILQGNQTSDQQERVNSFEAALATLEKARGLAPRDVNFTVEIALVYDALGRFEEAEWAFDRALDLDPKSYWLKQDYQAHLKRWKGTASASPSGS